MADWRPFTMRFLESSKEERRGLAGSKFEARTVFRSSVFFDWSCKITFQNEKKFLRINWIITNVYMLDQSTIVTEGSQLKYCLLMSQMKTNHVNNETRFMKVPQKKLIKWFAVQYVRKKLALCFKSAIAFDRKINIS